MPGSKILKFSVLSPPFLRCHIDKVFQSCVALVNLQFPLIKEGCEGTDFDFVL